MASRLKQVAVGLRPRMRIPDRAGIVVAAIVLPYGEELARCITTGDKE